MSDPITLAQSRAPPSPATATPPLPIAVAGENGALDAAAASELARSSGSLKVRGRSPTPSSRGDRYGGGADSEYGSVCGSLRGSSVRGSSPAVHGTTGGDDDKPRGTSPPPPVAPYQALPVRGPVITHNMTEGLPVVEPGETDPKVSGHMECLKGEREKKTIDGEVDKRRRPQPFPRKKLQNRFSQELEARMTKVISDYTAQLAERTEHHMG